MRKRWDLLVKMKDDEEAPLVVRGQTEEEARERALSYRGVVSIVSIKERPSEKTFPEPPAHLMGVHYRPLRWSVKLYG